MDKYTVFEEYATIIKEQLRQFLPDLDIVFTGYETHEWNTQTVINSPIVQSHPAHIEAKNLLRHYIDKVPEGFLGIVKEPKQKSSFMSSTPKSLAFIVCNIDELEKSPRPEAFLYHHMFQVLDIYDAFITGAIDDQKGTEIYIANVNSRANLRRNLQADLFSVFMLKCMDYKKAIKEVARIRAKHVISVTPDNYPEYYPYPIAMEATQIGWKILQTEQIQELDPIQKSLTLAEYVSVLFDDESLEEWASFCEQTQTMLWFGHNIEDVLGTAIDLSPNPKVRSHADLIAEILRVTPPPMEKCDQTYNAFAKQDVIMANHENAVNMTFRNVMFKTREHIDPKPFKDMADKQNLDLAQGIAFGWCAHALQIAYESFEQAPHQIATGGQFAKFQFEEHKDHLAEDVYVLAKIVMRRRRGGATVTLMDLLDIIDKNKMNPELAATIQKTLDSLGEFEVATKEEQDAEFFA